MKKKYRVLAVALSFCVFLPSANAQSSSSSVVKSGEWQEKEGFKYRKSVSEPTTQGVYTITLESFTTGELKLEAAPTDIVLVLDMSGSMKWRMGTDNDKGVNDNSSDSQYWSRFKTMKEGVLAFIEAIDDNDKYLPDDGDPSTPRVWRAKRLGNKIGIVTFAGSSATSVQTPIMLGNAALDTDNISGKNTLISKINGLPEPKNGNPRIKE